MSCGTSDSGNQNNVVDPGNGLDTGNGIGLGPDACGNATCASELSFSTFLDGSASSTGNTHTRDVAVDGSGNIYVTGGTASPSFITTVGAYGRTFNAGQSPGQSIGLFGAMDAFVAKFNSNGALLWSTYLGGRNYDRTYAIDVDDIGNVYVGGRAGEGFPTTFGAFQTDFSGDDNNANRGYGSQDGFVTKFSSNGNLIWSTYIGGPGSGFLRDIAVDPGTGEVFFGGSAYRGFSHSTNGAHQSMISGQADALYGKLSANGAEILFSSFLGGPGGGSDSDGNNPSVQVNKNNGELYALHNTASENACGSFGGGQYQSSLGGEMDVLLSRWSPTGALLACTYYGGPFTEAVETHGLAIDGSGNFIVAAGTRGGNLPAVAGGYDGTYNGGQFGDGFIAVVSKDGTILMASTYLGTGENDGIEGVAYSNGKILVSGTTSSPGYPTTDDAYQSNFNGGRNDMFMSVFSTDLSSLLYSTYLGGSGEDEGRTVAASPDGNIVFGGQTTSDNFPIQNSIVSSRSSNLTATLTKIESISSESE